MAFDSETQEEIFSKETRIMWKEIMDVRNIPECKTVLKKILPELAIAGQREFNKIIEETYQCLLPYIRKTI